MNLKSLKFHYGIDCIAQYILLIDVFHFFKEKTNLIQISGLLLTFIGVLILVSQGNLEILLLLALNYGDLIMFFSCSFYHYFLANH